MNKDKNKKLIYDNNFIKEDEKDNDINMNNDDDEFIPSLMKFGSLNYVNININIRKLIVTNYGNKHDLFSYKKMQKTILLEKKRNKSSKKSQKRKRNKKDKRDDNKYNKN